MSEPTNITPMPLPPVEDPPHFSYGRLFRSWLFQWLFKNDLQTMQLHAIHNAKVQSYKSFVAEQVVGQTIEAVKREDERRGLRMTKKY